MITMCNEDNRATLMLTPSHGRHMYALVVITSVLENALYAENVESLQQNDAVDVTKTIQQEMALVIRLLQHTSENKGATWDEVTSPIASKKCRSLDRSPTGPELNILDMKSAKQARTDTLLEVL